MLRVACYLSLTYPPLLVPFCHHIYGTVLHPVHLVHILNLHCFAGTELDKGHPMPILCPAAAELYQLVNRGPPHRPLAGLLRCHFPTKSMVP